MVKLQLFQEGSIFTPIFKILAKLCIHYLFAKFTYADINNSLRKYVNKLNRSWHIQIIIFSSPEPKAYKVSL